MHKYISLLLQIRGPRSKDVYAVQQANMAFGSLYLIPSPIKGIRAPGKVAYSRTGAGNTQKEPRAFCCARK